MPLLLKCINSTIHIHFSIFYDRKSSSVFYDMTAHVKTDYYTMYVILVVTTIFVSFDIIFYVVCLLPIRASLRACLKTEAETSSEFRVAAIGGLLCDDVK